MTRRGRAAAACVSADELNVVIEWPAIVATSPAGTTRTPPRTTGGSGEILRLYSLITRNQLLYDGRTMQVFEAELTDLQSEILTLLGVPRQAYRPPT